MKTSWIWATLALLLCVGMITGCGATEPDLDSLEVPENSVARIVFFRADDCEHCQRIHDEVILPLMQRCGQNLEVKTVDIAEPEGYEAFLATEEALIGESGRWEIPTVVVADTYLTGDSAIRTELLPHLSCVFGAGGNAWPEVEALTRIAALEPAPEGVGDGNPFAVGEGVESCATEEESAICASPVPIFALYFTPADCSDSCDRTRYDLRYLQGVYPQLSFEEREIDENLPLVQALGEAYGVPEAQQGVAPAVLVGEDYLVGEGLTLTALRNAVDRYTETGAKATWYTIEVP